jgi:hypothetical protein
MLHYLAELQHNSLGGGGSHAPPVQHRGQHTQVPPLREVWSVHNAYPVHQPPLGIQRLDLFIPNPTFKNNSGLMPDSKNLAR